MTIHLGYLLAAPPSTQIYLVSSPYPVILPGQEVLLRAYFNDPDFGETYNIKWDFGDGTTINKTLKINSDCYANPGRCTPYKYGCFSYITTSYSYKKPGTYKITLTIVDSRSERGQDLQTVEVVGPQVVTERLISTLREIPEETFCAPTTKTEVIRALDMVRKDLEEDPVEALEIMKRTVMPGIAGPRHNRCGSELTEAVPLFEALVNHLSLQQAS